jgi:hypothetical protein
LVRLAVLVIIGFLFVSIGAAVEARALTNAVDVMVLVDRTAADYGESVNVTAFVFDRAIPTDPSSIVAFVNRLPGLSPLNLTRQSAGVFTGVFVFESHPSEVLVNATVDGTQDSGQAYVVHRFQPGVRIVPSTGVARPGETVSVEVDVADSSGPQDAVSVNLTAAVLSAPNFALVAGTTRLSLTHVATGTYQASYALPSDLNRDSFVDFRADVTVVHGSFSLGAGVYVPFSNVLLVWYRTVSSGPSNASLLVYVASTAGVPLGDANVSIRTFSFLFGPRTLNGTTNASGAARFDLPSNESVTNDFVGNASYGSLSQSFQGFFEPPPPPAVQAPQVFRLNTDEIFAPGETANLRFRLEQNGSGIPHQDLFVYAHTGTEFVLAEPVSTDATGEFAVRFIAPSDAVRLDVAGFIGGAWRSFSQGFVARNHLVASILSPDGRHLSIHGSFPIPAGPWTAYLRLNTVQEPNALEGPLAAAGNFGVAALAAGSAGGTFTFDIRLPSFLPSGLRVVVSIETVSLRLETGINGLHLFSQIVIVGTPILGPTNLGPWVLLAGVAFLVAVLVVVRQRRRPPTTRGQTSHADEAVPESPETGADTNPPRK